MAQFPCGYAKGMTKPQLGNSAIYFTQLSYWFVSKQGNPDQVSFWFPFKAPQEVVPTPKHPQRYVTLAATCPPWLKLARSLARSRSALGVNMR